MSGDRPPIDRRSNDHDCQQRKGELCRNHDPRRNGANPRQSAMKDTLHEGRLVKLASENECPTPCLKAYGLRDSSVPARR